MSDISKQQSELSRFIDRVMEDEIGVGSDPIKLEEYRQKKRYASNKKLRQESAKEISGL